MQKNTKFFFNLHDFFLLINMFIKLFKFFFYLYIYQIYIVFVILKKKEEKKHVKNFVDLVKSKFFFVAVVVVISKCISYVIKKNVSVLCSSSS